jgi:hypothetical protein
MDADPLKCKFCEYRTNRDIALYEHLANVHSKQLQRGSPKKGFSSIAYSGFSGRSYICDNPDDERRYIPNARRRVGKALNCRT